MTNKALTYPIGASGFRRRYDDEDAGPPLQMLKEGKTLRDLADDYTFFTYAPLFLYGGLEHNPIQEWLNMRGLGEVVHFVFLPRDVVNLALTATSVQPWNRLLWAVENKHWNDLAHHIGGIGLLDGGRKRFTRVICQQIPIADCGLGNAGRISSDAYPVEIYVFTVDSNHSCWPIAPARDLAYDVPKLLHVAPREETIELAIALLSSSEDPYRVIEERT